MFKTKRRYKEKTPDFNVIVDSICKNFTIVIMIIYGNEVEYSFKRICANDLNRIKENMMHLKLQHAYNVHVLNCKIC